MAHSFRAHYFHLVWSTHQRKPLISPEIRTRLYPYMVSTIHGLGGVVLEIGGMPDHLHILVQMGVLDKFTALVQGVKASSSQWISKTFPIVGKFAWQEGYGSFSVSQSGLEGVQEYIRNQETHHAVMTFEEEYRKLLVRHNIKFDERFVYG